MNLITREIFFEISIENLQKESTENQVTFRKSTEIVQKQGKYFRNIHSKSSKNTENLQKYIEINVRK